MKPAAPVTTYRITGESLVLQESQRPSVDEVGDAENGTADEKDEQRDAYEEAVGGDPVEGRAEGDRPCRGGRQHVARFENVTVGRGVADREVEVAENAEPRQKRDRDERRRTPPDRHAHESDPAGDRKQRRQQPEIALLAQLIFLARRHEVPSRVPAEDAEVVAPEIAVRRRQ